MAQQLGTMGVRVMLRSLEAQSQALLTGSACIGSDTAEPTAKLGSLVQLLPSPLWHRSAVSEGLSSEISVD